MKTEDLSEIEIVDLASLQNAILEMKGPWETVPSRKTAPRRSYGLGPIRPRRSSSAVSRLTMESTLSLPLRFAILTISGSNSAEKSGNDIGPQSMSSGRPGSSNSGIGGCRGGGALTTFLPFRCFFDAAFSLASMY